MKKIVFTLAALLALAGCGSSSHASGKSTADLNAQISKLFIDLDCPGTDVYPGHAASEGAVTGTCVRAAIPSDAAYSETTPLDVFVFPKPSSRDTWLKTARSVAGFHVMADSWAIQCGTQEEADSAVDATFGNIS